MNLAMLLVGTRTEKEVMPGEKYGLHRIDCMRNYTYFAATRPLGPAPIMAIDLIFLGN
jgi:hypothetical protein